MAEEQRPTRENLAAMHQEYAQAHPDKPGLDYNLDDHIKQARIVHRHGRSAEEFAADLNVPLVYARALLRYAQPVEDS